MGYAPGLSSPKRPISVLAQNLGGIPSIQASRHQGIFFFTYLPTTGQGWPKAMKA